jgi:hypothetical protein
METLLNIVLLAAPFALLGGAIWAAIMILGSAASRQR